MEKIYPLEVDGFKMHGVLTVVREQAPFVIFSHGYNGTEKNLAHLCQLLAEQGINSYRFDFLGGSVNETSDMSTEEMTILTEMRDLLVVVDHFKAQPFIDPNQLFLFGASMGGLVSSLVAEARKEVTGLFLMFPAFSVAKDWQKKFKSKADIPDRLIFWGMPLGYSFFDVLFDFQLEEELGSYEGPVYIIHGDHDEVVSHTVTDWVKPLYKNLEIQILPGEGHGFSKAGEDKTSEALRQFIQKH
ncbi:MAG: alpha/beta hydrolase family protein [Bacillota bacterium]